MNIDNCLYKAFCNSGNGLNLGFVDNLVKCSSKLLLKFISEVLVYCTKSIFRDVNNGSWWKRCYVVSESSGLVCQRVPRGVA